MSTHFIPVPKAFSKLPGATCCARPWQSKVNTIHSDEQGGHLAMPMSNAATGWQRVPVLEQGEYGHLALSV